MEVGITLLMSVSLAGARPFAHSIIHHSSFSSLFDNRRLHYDGAATGTRSSSLPNLLTALRQRTTLRSPTGSAS